LVDSSKLPDQIKKIHLVPMECPRNSVQLL
jgi:hypothetical protein